MKECFQTKVLFSQVAIWLLTLSMLFFSRLSTARRIGLVSAAIFYIVAGALHFISTDSYVKIMPPYIPWHAELVRASGIFEILGGLGLLLPRTRKLAAGGLIVLLIAVFPANLYMATNPIESGSLWISPILRWGRLPLQFLLAWWLVWCSSQRDPRMA